MTLVWQPGCLYTEVSWDPSVISTALWLDAADASTLTTGAGGRVSQWNDKSGSGIHATQTNPVAQPIFLPTGLNGRECIYFPANGEFLTLPTGFLSGFTDVSVAFVLLGPLQNNNAIFGPATTNSVGLELVWTNVAGWPTLVRINGVNKITSGLWSTDNLPTISTLQVDAFTTAGWLNGSPVNAVSPTGTTPLNFNGVYSIGTYSTNFGDLSANMNLGEFIVSTSSWSTTDRQRIEGYLAHKWGLTANLPSDHPYKTTGPTRKIAGIVS